MLRKRFRLTLEKVEKEKLVACTKGTGKTFAFFSTELNVSPQQAVGYTLKCGKSKKQTTTTN